METKIIIKESITEKCGGCERIEFDHVQCICKCYAVPAAQWRRGNCPMATHVKKETSNSVKSGKLNPLKASKRSVKGG